MAKLPDETVEAIITSSQTIAKIKTQEAVQAIIKKQTDHYRQVGKNSFMHYSALDIECVLVGIALEVAQL